MQKNPRVPVLKRRTAQGDWEELDSTQLFNGPVDPEWRVFGLSSADDKAPIMMFLAAIDAIKADGVAPGINVKFLLDSEEEKGSPSIGRNNRPRASQDWDSPIRVFAAILAADSQRQFSTTH